MTENNSVTPRINGIQMQEGDLDMMAIKTETGDIAQEQVAEEASTPIPPYTIYTSNEKKSMLAFVTFALFFSPISSTIYYPALSPIATDLNVSDSMINITITTFMIFQGLAPTFIGAFADAEGRRPAYIISFVLYIVANIGLALQKDYIALLVLRCLQSSGSSGTIALANAVVADFAMSYERGKWQGLANAGGMIGPSVAPIIGGALTASFGWSSIFWFMAILAGVYFIPMVLFFPESCRAVVGNGSQRPESRWNRCLLDPAIKKRVEADPSVLEPPIPPHRLRFPNPLKALLLIFDKEAFLPLLCSALVFSGYYAFLAIAPSQFEQRSGFDPLHVGLCYLPSGVGSFLAAVLGGRVVDLNFRRHARKLGLDAAETQRLRSLSTFPVEAARLEVAMPLVLVGSIAITAFGWTMHNETHLAVSLTISFFIGFCATGAFTVINTLLVDFYPDNSATAVAAGNITRCWLGAGATALVVPLVKKIGMGWTFTTCGAVWICLCPLMLVVIKTGPGFRQAKEKRILEQNESLH